MRSRIINWLNNLSGFEKVFLTFLLVSQVYYFYRYILRFGSPFSPPGYQLTPAILQYAKYAIALVFLLILAACVLRNFRVKQVWEQLLKQKFWILTIFFIIYISVSLLKFGVSPESFGISQTVKMLFVVPFVLFAPFIWKDKKPFGLLKIFVLISLAYHVIYELYMIAMFFLFKQLPGLAFSRLLPRYGGGWDDPNGFGAFVVLLIVVILLIPFPKQRIKNLLMNLVLAVLILLLLLTYSVTAVIGLFVALTAMFLLKKLEFKKLLVILVTLTAFVVIHWLSGYLQLLYEAKLASSLDHLSTPGRAERVIEGSMTPLQTTADFTFGSFSQATFHENIYLQIFLNYGLVGLVLLVLIQVATIYRAFAGWLYTPERDFEKKTLFFTGFFYLTAFAVMNLGIPFFQVYPINLFAWILIGLVWVLPIDDYDKKKTSLINSWSQFMKGLVGK